MPSVTDLHIKIHHLDVGQGDSTLIVFKEGKNDKQGHGYTIKKAILIDGGDTSTIGERIKTYLMQKLREAGNPGDPNRPRKCLDAIICTHYDEDHIGGLPTIISSSLCEIGTKIYDTGNWDGYPPKNTEGKDTQVFKNYLKSIADKRDELIKREINKLIKNAFGIELNEDLFTKIKDYTDCEHFSELSNPPPEIDRRNIKGLVREFLEGIRPPIDPPRIPALVDDIYQKIISVIEKSKTEKWLDRVTEVVDSTNQNYLVEEKIVDFTSAPPEGYGVSPAPQMICIAANGYILDDKNTQTLLSDSGSSGTQKNQRCLAFLIKYGAFCYYIGGDIGQAQELRIANYLSANNSKSDSFKVSHHGSEHSTPIELVKDGLQDNAVALISYGNNEYFHPTPIILSRLYNTKNDTNNRHKIKKLYFTGNLYKNDLDNKKVLKNRKSRAIDITSLNMLATPAPEIGKDSEGQQRNLCPGNVILTFSFNTTIRKWKMDISYDLFNFSLQKAGAGDAYYVSPIFFQEAVKSGIKAQKATRARQVSKISNDFAREASILIFRHLKSEQYIDETGKVLKTKSLLDMKNCLENFCKNEVAALFNRSRLTQLTRFDSGDAIVSIHSRLDDLFLVKENFKKIRAIFQTAVSTAVSEEYNISKITDAIKQYG